MRKLFLAILTIVYLGTSTGFSVSLHYCMGHPSDWNIGLSSSDRCNTCGMKKTNGKDNGCCKDESKFFKNNADQKINEPGMLASAPVSAILPVSFFENYILPDSAENTFYPILHHPPPYSSIALYIRNAFFLI